MSELVIDPEAFNTLKSMTDSAFLVELIDVFLVDSPDLINQMHLALAEGNAEVLRRAAHSLKSNSASFGATRLTGLCREVEMMAKEGRQAEAGPKLEELAAEYEKVAPALVELKNEC